MSDIIGGPGGGFFEDRATDANLTAVHLAWKNVLLSVVCEYQGGSKSEYHGANHDGQQSDTFYLAKDEAIITAYIWSGDRLDAIQFQTTKGRLSPKYGGNGGVCFVFRGSKAGRERALMGFKGRSGTEIDAIGPVWSDKRALGAQQVVVGEAKGGSGGNAFDMLRDIGNPLNKALKTIIVHHDAVVNGIELKYQDNTSSGRKGEAHGKQSVFELGPNERVVKIAGRYGSRIDRLQFNTNERWSENYGGNGGVSFVWEPPSTGGDSASDANMSLLCFQGGSASQIDRLAPVWAVDPPVKFSLDITRFDEISNVGGAKPSVAWTKSSSQRNGTSRDMEYNFSWEASASQSSTLSMSESSRTLIGGSVSLEVTAGGKAGVPFVAEGEVSTTAGISVNMEHEWGSTVTSDVQKSNTFSMKCEDKVTIPPKTRTVATATGKQFSIKGLKWWGRMNVTYAGGSKKTFDVDGTLDSASCVNYDVNTDEHDL